MTSVVFVHGTGVRKDAYDESFDRVASELGKLANLSALPYYWGHLGSELHAGGASIPEYDSTRSLEDLVGATVTDEEYSAYLWGILYEDHCRCCCSDRASSLLPLFLFLQPSPGRDIVLL